MFRNREQKIYWVTMTLIALLGTIGAFIMNKTAGYFTLWISALLIVVSICYIRWRYKEISKLSGYLRNVANGDFSLDPRDNEEGELSILKNEIYKMTLMLSKQGELLLHEKENLANALSDISHQLKTPLTSMMMMADLLSDPNLRADKRQEFTKNIEIQLERMEWLLTSLLKLSKIDAGTVVFKKEQISADLLVERALKPLMIPMELKEQHLEVTTHPEITVYLDANWTVEALINILKNCIEHTGIGGIISISLTDNPLYLEIRIKDNGVGIDKVDLPYIFKRFYKGKNAGEESVGIGLAMAHSIITNQNGDLGVTSEKGKGTQFSIKFYKNKYGK